MSWLVILNMFAILTSVKRTSNTKPFEISMVFMRMHYKMGVMASYIWMKSRLVYRPNEDPSMQLRMFYGNALSSDRFHDFSTTSLLL